MELARKMLYISEIHGWLKWNKTVDSLRVLVQEWDVAEVDAVIT